MKKSTRIELLDYLDWQIKQSEKLAHIPEMADHIKNVRRWREDIMMHGPSDVPEEATFAMVKAMANYAHDHDEPASTFYRGMWKAALDEARKGKE
jgi:hypothetical protein